MRLSNLADAMQSELGVGTPLLPLALGVILLALGIAVVDGDSVRVALLVMGVGSNVPRVLILGSKALASAPRVLVTAAPRASSNAHIRSRDVTVSARYLATIDPDNEVPGEDLLRISRQRVAPYSYSEPKSKR